MQTTYKARPVRSPYQQHPIHRMREKAMDTQDSEHPIRREVRKLCGTYSLSATFSEDTGTLSTLKTPGLIAIRCVLSKDNKPIGVGHGSSAVSRINRGIERTIFSCLNGALMSAVNSACKSLDVMRLESAQERSAPIQNINDSSFMDAEDTNIELATERQREYLRQLITVNVQDERERDKWESQLGELTKDEASKAIQSFKQ